MENVGKEVEMRAKFSVTRVEQELEGYKVTLVPVYSGSKENREFFQYTPFGKIEIGLISPSIALRVGHDYYVDFTPAPEPAPTISS